PPLPLPATSQVQVAFMGDHRALGVASPLAWCSGCGQRKRISRPSTFPPRSITTFVIASTSAGSTVVTGVPRRLAAPAALHYGMASSRLPGAPAPGEPTPQPSNRPPALRGRHFKADGVDDLAVELHLRPPEDDGAARPLLFVFAEA